MQVVLGFPSLKFSSHYTISLNVTSIQVQKSPIFRRDGADIHSDLQVSVAQAILGGTARAQGLYETLNLSVSRKKAVSIYSTVTENYNRKKCSCSSSDPCRNPVRPQNSPFRKRNRSRQWIWLWRSLHPCENKNTQVRYFCL